MEILGDAELATSGNGASHLQAEIMFQKPSWDSRFLNIVRNIFLQTSSLSC